MSSDRYQSGVELRASSAQSGKGSLAAALREAGTSLDDATGDSETQSEEDYDENIRPAFAKSASNLRLQKGDPEETQALSAKDVKPIFRRDSGVHILADTEGDLQELLKRSSKGDTRSSDMPPRRRLRDLVFTKQFSAFDSHNQASANSPFHGFYNLFWLAVAIFVFRISVINWYNHGTILGSSDIMKTMFRRDGKLCPYQLLSLSVIDITLVIVLLLSDGVMCGLTGVSWILQLLVYRRYINWNRTGWIIQNVGFLE